MCNTVIHPVPISGRCQHSQQSLSMPIVTLSSCPVQNLMCVTTDIGVWCIYVPNSGVSDALMMLYSSLYVSGLSLSLMPGSH